MCEGASFDSVLDETIKAHAPQLPKSPNGCAEVRTAATYGFFFVDPQPPTGAVAVGPRGAAGLASSHRLAPPLECHWSTPLPASPSRTMREARADVQPAGPGAAIESASSLRSLCRRQRAALAEMVALGARLGDDFTAEELRSAFRTLARRYHPDRHAQSSESDRSRYAMLFRRVHDAYRTLTE